MELEVIRHKTAGDFFKGFSSSEEEAAYSYQLERMFESGAAREGDYFVVKDSGFPYLRVEIFRNNTRRLWEKEPEPCRPAETDGSKTESALNLIFEFLDDELYYPRITDALEISLKSDGSMTPLMEKMCSKYGYFPYDTLHEYEIKANPAASLKPEPGSNFEPMINYDPQTRFELVSSNDPVRTIFKCEKAELIYQDHLDDSYMSEQNWKVISENGKPAGYFMPSFTSGLKNTLRLTAYSLPENPDVLLYKDIISEMLRITEEHKALKIELPIKEEDAEFRNAVEMCGGILKHTIRKFAKNAAVDRH